MTIIAAAKGPEGIFIGGDSVAGTDDDLVYLSDPKVFSHHGFTFGYAGSFRFGQILKHCFVPPRRDPKLDDFTYMFSVWLESLRVLLNKKGLIKNTEGVETIGEDGMCLIIYRECAYHLQHDLSLLRLSSSYIAIGGGDQLTIGAMYALQGSGLGTQETLEKAISAAIHHSPKCGGPVTIIKHDPTTELKWVKPRTRKKPAPVVKPKIVRSHKKVIPLKKKARLRA